MRLRLLRLRLRLRFRLGLGLGLRLPLRLRRGWSRSSPRPSGRTARRAVQPFCSKDRSGRTGPHGGGGVGRVRLGGAWFRPPGSVR
ncbi:hypothetical protein Sgleb_69900 [Streptomyces glebosus]|uniref:Uncharacterized protein n=1 Tax=Streptomyces glebosus TaxID=249580 RepID=A0A640T5I3_9ACTN|nr:hypothetical protein Sgleb_69900 [Streptomyces glebosus]GHG48866.1 hypothetical protein GCM10010513_06120 [Streptomyces glebosus]